VRTNLVIGAFITDINKAIASLRVGKFAKAAKSLAGSNFPSTDKAFHL